MPKQAKHKHRTKPLEGQASKKEKNTFLLLDSSLGLLLQLGGLIFQSRIILLQSFNPGLQKPDLYRLLPRRLLKSSHLLKLLRLVSCQLEILPSPPKELGLLSNLSSQILPTKCDQDKVLNNSTKVLEYKKIPTTRTEWQPKISRAKAVDPTTGFSTSYRTTSCKEGSTMAAVEGLFD